MTFTDRNWWRSDNALSYKIELHNDKSMGVTTARVSFGGMYAVGSAKLAPGDVWSEAVGEWLATARAMRKLARHLKNASYDSIHEMDKAHRTKVNLRSPKKEVMDAGVRKPTDQS